MAKATLAQNSLVLYKNKPAAIKKTGNRLEIELNDGRQMKVRAKDVQLLHPGPIQKLQSLTPQTGDLETAWELLAGETTNLAELADLIYDAYTPATAWAAWQHVADGLYFYGSPEQIIVRTAAEVAERQAAQAAKEAQAQAYAAFLSRIQQRQITSEDEQQLQEIERLALEEQMGSRIMSDLGLPETPERAHSLLLELGYWQPTDNPYPRRLGLPTEPPAVAFPNLPQEGRLDLTHLPAFAIDDAGSRDPDDALSLDGNRLWVHIADVAAIVTPDSAVDQAARAYGTNLYLPEKTITMLPPAATQHLALGLADISPALSFGLDLDAMGAVTNLEIKPSWIKVQRLSYEEAEAQLDQEPFASLHHLAQQNRVRREANEAVEIDLPEVKVRVRDKQVIILPLPSLNSRELVREAMLLCGQAVAQFAMTHDIPMPYATQEPPAEYEELPGLAGMFAKRRAMQRSQLKTIPGAHAGLGLPHYVQATSPLRRYLDLVAHQQLRAYLRDGPLLDTPQILERVGMFEAINGSARQAERLSNKHWTLIYLQQQSAWQGTGVIVERRGRRSLVLIPDLDLEVRMNLSPDPTLNSQVSVDFKAANLPELEATFGLLG